MIRTALGSEDDGRTKFFAPFLKRQPLFAGRHIKQVSDDWEALGSRRKGMIAPLLPSGYVQGHQAQTKNDKAKIQEKVPRHIWDKNSLTRTLGSLYLYRSSGEGP